MKPKNTTLLFCCLIKRETYLVMALSIGDGALHPAAVGERVHDVRHIPVVVLLFLQEFDPHVRYSHAEAVVEPGTPFAHRTTRRRHTAHVLRAKVIQIFTAHVNCLRG